MRKHTVVVPEGITIKRDGHRYICSNGKHTLYIRHNYRTDDFDLYERNGTIGGNLLTSRGFLRDAKKDAIDLLQGNTVVCGFNRKIRL